MELEPPCHDSTKMEDHVIDELADTARRVDQLVTITMCDLGTEADEEVQLLNATVHDLVQLSYKNMRKKHPQDVQVINRFI